MSIQDTRLERGERLEGVASKAHVEAFTPCVDDYGRRAATFEGLGFHTAWLWAGVTGEDGRRYALLREHEVGCSYLYFGLEIAPDIWSDPGVRHANFPGVDDLYCGAVRYEADGEAHLISATNPAYPAMEVSLSPTKHTWREADWMDIAMEPLGVAMRYRCPGEPDDFGYTSQICRVTGTVDGQVVQGFGGYDRYYGEPGVVWGQSKGFRFLEELWWVWAGEHADGRQEHGTAITGPGEFRVGFFHRDGEEPIAVNELAADVEWEERDGRRLPVAATLRFAGREFKYRATGNVTIPGADLFINWVHGELTESGSLVPVQLFSWLEFFKHLATPGDAV